MNTPTLKLGKLPPKIDDRTLALGAYLDDSKLPSPPPKIDWAARVGGPWGVMLNTDIGDCAIAGPGHLEMVWTAAKFSPADSAILDAYRAVSGYNPSDPSTDTGCVLLDVLKYWRNVGIAGKKIAAFATVNVRNKLHVRAALDLFGGLDIGLALPASAQSQVGKIWRTETGDDAEAGSWGGHCVAIVGADEAGLTCVTWGELQRMTWDFFRNYCDEAYACLSDDWCDGNKVAPSGFNLDQLMADLKLVA